ncbi:MAG TPA: hypothetical protein QGF58_08090 [Myxococcota bacterium]|nr:hypothetical protein [Myxococcota bacterium]
MLRAQEVSRSRLIGRVLPRILLSLAIGLPLAGAAFGLLGPEDCRTELGGGLLELALLLLVGIWVKPFVDDVLASRDRAAARARQREDFLRRVRDVHGTIMSARDLMNAHGSARTYGEQMRRLLELRAEVVEITEDVKVSAHLFEEHNVLVDGLEDLVVWLEGGDSLHETLEASEMTWVRGLMDMEGTFEAYDESIRAVKSTLRKTVYSA